MSKFTERRKRAAVRRWWLEPRALVVQLGCAAILGTTGCTTMRPVGHDPGAEQVIDPGDTVVVTTRDGRERELVFADWTSEALTGTDETGIRQKIANEDIIGVEVQKFSPLKSIGLALVIVTVAAAAVVDDLVDALED